MSNKRIFLRPHHGLCLRFFSGNGYDDAFCRNIVEVLHFLKPDTLLQLTGSQDGICLSCPNRNNRCPGAERYDLAVLSYCELSFGQELCWLDFQQLLYRQILAPGKLSEICGDCQWASICGKYANSK